MHFIYTYKYNINLAEYSSDMNIISFIWHEEPYKKAINDMIISTLSCKTLTSLTKREKWDLCKIKIKEFSIKYCKIRSATKKNELHVLETEINNIDQLIINNNDDDFLLNRRSELKNKLDALLTEKTIGYQIRSKSNGSKKGRKIPHTF